MSGPIPPPASAGDAQAHGGAPWAVSALLLLGLAGMLVFLYLVAGPDHAPASLSSSAPQKAASSRARTPSPSGHASGGLASPAAVDLESTEDAEFEQPSADDADVPVDDASVRPEAR